MAFEKKMMEFLYKKYFEIAQQNVLHELNLVAEQFKNAELQEKIDELNKKLENYSKKKKKEEPQLDGETF
jgi:uncharacterized coiled-coil protein SlyX